MKTSFDFQILYDFIIHTPQNWLPVNLITVTPISHKYANTIQTCWALRRGEKKVTSGEDLLKTPPQITSPLIASRAALFFKNCEVSRFPEQHVVPKQSMLACQSKFNHTKWEHSVLLSSLPLLLSGCVSNVVRTEADMLVRGGHNNKDRRLFLQFQWKYYKKKKLVQWRSGYIQQLEI